MFAGDAYAQRHPTGSEQVGISAYCLTSPPYDVQSGFYSRISSFGQLNTTEVVRLVGGEPAGDATTSQVWDTTGSGGGALVTYQGIVELKSGGGNSGRAFLGTRDPARYYSPYTNVYLGEARVDSTGSANNGNFRRWGVFTQTDGLFFQISGSTFGAVVRKTGSDMFIPHTSFSNSTATLDTNFHVWEIYYSHGFAQFFQDRRIMHSYEEPQLSLCATMSLPASAESQNSATSTAALSLFVRDMSIVRYCGQEPETPNYNINNTQVTGTLKSVPGHLHRVIITRKGVGNGVVDLYDGATQITSIDTGAPVGSSFELFQLFKTSLIVQTSASPGWVTIVYD